MLGQTERAAIDVISAHREPHHFRVSTVKEGEKYRATAQRLREEADRQHDHLIGDQFRKIADRYDELAQQVEATARRAD